MSGAGIEFETAAQGHIPVTLATIVGGVEVEARNGRWAQIEDGENGSAVLIVGYADDQAMHLIVNMGTVEMLQIAYAWLRGAWTTVEEFWALPQRHDAAILEE